MKGSQGIPELQLVTLNKLIRKFPNAPSLYFTNMFASPNYESDSIEWDFEYGSAGMTPFVAPGSPAPSIGLDGIGKAEAKAAFREAASHLGLITTKAYFEKIMDRQNQA